MKSINCVSCNSTLYLKHNDISHIVCASCGTLLSHKDGQTYLVHSQDTGNIREDANVLGIGTLGKYQGRTFEITGRIRVWAENSVYNYWTILCHDQLLILAEGYGKYAILEEDTHINISSTERLDTLYSNKRYTHPYHHTTNYYHFYRKDLVHKIDLEGQVKLPVLNAHMRIFDLVLDTEEERFLCFIEYAKDIILDYIVSPFSYSDLCFTQLPSSRPAKKLSCQNCNTEIEARGYPYILTYICPGCSCPVSHSGAQNLTTLSFPSEQKGYIIPLGTSITVKGKRYTLIGSAVKEELGTDEQWREYVLSHPEEGFAFLSEYGGHWQYVIEKDASPLRIYSGSNNRYDRVIDAYDVKEFKYGKSTFELYNRYQYKNICAEGAFPYDLPAAAYHNRVSEFIEPPYMWFFEQYKNQDVEVFFAEYIPAGDILDQIGQTERNNHQTGIGLLEPNRYFDLVESVRLFCLGMALLLIVFLFTSYNARQQNVVSSTLYFNDTAATTRYTSPPITLDKYKSDLEVDFTAPDLQNNWVEFNTTLTNRRTGDAITLTNGLEYYSGYEEGSSWSEGKQNDDYCLNSIAKGTYILEVEVQRAEPLRYTTDSNSYTVSAANSHLPTYVIIKATYDVPSYRNLFLLGLCLLIYIIVSYLMYYRKEQKRWSGSQYSKYKISSY